MVIQKAKYIALKYAILFRINFVIKMRNFFSRYRVKNEAVTGEAGCGGPGASLHR